MISLEIRELPRCLCLGGVQSADYRIRTPLGSILPSMTKLDAATGAAAVFGLCTFFLILNLLAKLVFRYKRGNNTTMEATHHIEMGPVPVGAEAYDQEEGQRGISCSSSAYWGQAVTPDLLNGFDLVSCTQHGITLHSAKSPLRPKEHDGPQRAANRGSSAFCNPPLTKAEHRSSPPQPATASSAEASTTNMDRQPRWPFFPR